MSDTPVHGTCHPAFGRVREVFEQSFDAGEVGSGVCAVVDGRVVVDLWGGWADAERSREWQRDTIVNTWSTTKGMTSICAHRLVERGQLDVDEAVATYWPEFAQAGKGHIPVRWLLSHQAGLPTPATQPPREQRYDWDAVTSGLAAQAPAWEPGTRNQYHALTFGYLVGEVVRRISGRSLGTFFREEVADPLGADFLIGFGPEHDARCADILPASAPANGQQAARGRRGTGRGMGRGTNTREWRQAEIPAANGHGTAAAVARVYGALARGGELDGVHVLSDESIERALVAQVPRAPDGSPGPQMFPFGLGFMLLGKMIPTGVGKAAFGHPGAGGSIGLADPAAKLGFGYVMNQMQAGMTGGAHGFALLRAIYECLEA